MEQKAQNDEIIVATAKIAIFKGKRIRKTIFKDEWWFSVADVVEILTDSINVTDYIKKLRKRDDELGKGWGQIFTPLLTVGDRTKDQL